MQDRFKFRVWDKENKCMYYPTRYSNFTIVNGTVVKIESYPIANSAYLGKRIALEFDDTVIMQCTGSKDYNGKLMYEGDIVKIWKFSKDLYGNDKRVIKWNDTRCGFRLYTIDQYKRGIELCPQSMVNVTTIEVIGNIFQNPELLKDGE